jgi:hypothetical protein
MSDFLLLKNIRACPKCFANRTARHSGRCQNCGAMLFNSLDYNFKQYDLDGATRIWWAFCPQRGWVSRSFVLNPNQEAQKSVYVEEEIPADYGKQFTPSPV